MLSEKIDRFRIRPKENPRARRINEEFVITLEKAVAEYQRATLGMKNFSRTHQHWRNTPDQRKFGIFFWQWVRKIKSMKRKFSERRELVGSRIILDAP